MKAVVHWTTQPLPYLKTGLNNLRAIILNGPTRNRWIVTKKELNVWGVEI